MIASEELEHWQHVAAELENELKDARTKLWQVRGLAEEYRDDYESGGDLAYKIFDALGVD